MGNDFAKYLIPTVPVVVLIILAIFYAVDRRQKAASEQKRTVAFLQVARQLGLKFHPGKDTELPHQYFFVQRLARGTNRYAINSLTGDYQGHRISAFDYHYEITSVDSDETTHHHCSALILHVDKGDQLAEFPHLSVAPEIAGSSFANPVGAGDINFESLEFSRMFRVQSKDKKFAYDICHGRFMEYLLANPGLTLEYNLYTIALIFNRRLKPEEIRPNLDRLLAVRSLVPDYLLTPA